MNAKGIEIFKDIIRIHEEDNAIINKYPRMRSLLERACKDLTINEHTQFSNLFTRLNYLCEKYNYGKENTYNINTLRVNANKVLHAEFQPTKIDYLHDLKALCKAISHFYAVTIPKRLRDDLPVEGMARAKVKYADKQIIIRVRVVEPKCDEEFIYAIIEDLPSKEPIKIRYNVIEKNREFNQTVNQIWVGCQLNLLFVTQNTEGVYLPEIIILEPDYLVDISSVAECIKDYGAHPLNYLISKFDLRQNTAPILLGNAANTFLDLLIYEKVHDPVNFMAAMSVVFKSSPLEFSTCEDLKDRSKEIEFFNNAKNQFCNIRNNINSKFPEIELEPSAVLLEPTFICEQLGLQGRLDLLQLATGETDKKNIIIELKSGKAPFPETDFTLISHNHKSQVYLYQLTLQMVLGLSFDKLRAYILYSKYTDLDANLRLNMPNLAYIRGVLNIRNLIVANESIIARDQNNQATVRLLEDICPDKLFTKPKGFEKLLEKSIKPKIAAFKKVFEQEDDSFSLAYFHCYYAFVTKEHYISKIGDNTAGNTNGASSLWLTNDDDKLETGTLLMDLRIINNDISSNNQKITFSIPKIDQDVVPNFREGDIVLLYEKNKKSDNVRNKQIFKGTIEKLTQVEITVQLRHKQESKVALPDSSNYAIEQDFLDSSFNSMYKSLYTFLQADGDRKKLLVGLRDPRQAESTTLINNYEDDDYAKIIYNSKLAKDYFLLLGPPGSGKTSRALKNMVEEFYADDDANILLLAYTNRAVDEICGALTNVNGRPQYVRIGSELNCAPVYTEFLLERVIQNCQKRTDVKELLSKIRIFVGTIATVANKPELFKIKHFKVAIIDEASQILEPSLIGILSAKHGPDTNAIDKFVLIGDHKQLPAVVLQNDSQTLVRVPELNKLGFLSTKESIFERLYRINSRNEHSLAIGQLRKQGRMHPDVALFPNHAFYNGQLKLVPTPHQNADLEFKKYDSKNVIQKLISTRRIAFIPSITDYNSQSPRNNLYEAKIVKELVRSIHELYLLNNLGFHPAAHLGIITPYRSQIALIKRELHKLNIPELDDITIDTVERFQGSERDIIIYSFSINEYYQLDALTSHYYDGGQLIDRKLNVAITRAKKQLFVIGNPAILANNRIYHSFISFIQSQSGFIQCQPDDFILGKFNLEDPSVDVALGHKVILPDENFSSVFEQLVINPLRLDPRTKFPNILLGFDSNYNRTNVIEYGRTKFDERSKFHSPIDKVNLYCYFNMRKHYFSSVAIFRGFEQYFKSTFENTGNRILFIDFGCGPLTSGLALNHSFSDTGSFFFHYIGLDISEAMLEKAKEFSNSGLFNRSTRFQFKRNLDDIDIDYFNDLFSLSNTVILNFSYLFGNLSIAESSELAEKVNKLMIRYPLNKYILIYQNSSIEERSRSYLIFKSLIEKLKTKVQPRIEKIAYKNAILSNYDKSETVYYELLEN